MHFFFNEWEIDALLLSTDDGKIHFLQWLKARYTSYSCCHQLLALLSGMTSTTQDILLLWIVLSVRTRALGLYPLRLLRKLHETTLINHPLFGGKATLMFNAGDFSLTQVPLMTGTFLHCMVLKWLELFLQHVVLIYDWNSSSNTWSLHN